MSVRTLVLGALAAIVAVGGVYLLIEVRSSGATPPSDKAIKEAADRHARTGSASTRAPKIEDLNSDPSRAAGRMKTAVSPETDRRIAEAIKQENDRQQASGGGSEVEGGDPAANPDYDSAMLEANKLYDRHNYEEARTLAIKLLERQPGTVRMLRVVVSSSCILGDGETAQKYWTQLPDFDRSQMTTRCERFGVTFTP